MTLSALAVRQVSVASGLRTRSQRLGCPAKSLLATALLFVLSATFGAQSLHAQTFGCNPPAANDIVCENGKAGNPATEWDVSTGDAGDATIQGFATAISVNQGQTVSFKINTSASSYSIKIYRIGYYAGLGARFIASVTPSAKLPQNQPACLTDSSTFLYDCGNWAVSASWQVPTNATSGVYVAHLIRNDTGGDSHIVFVVRNDSSHSAILFQTADTSWQAYNNYGGHSLYGTIDGKFDVQNRAYKVSYNRPFTTRGWNPLSWFFHAEYPMVRWLEANGYDVTYFTGIDTDRSGSVIVNHRMFMSVGHDEYWSGAQRTNVEAARNSGVHLSFFSGNEVFWKTRWENSTDGSATPYRTLVCYKETLGETKLDPLDPPTWTGTWRDKTFSPPGDGGNPENALHGNIFMVNGPGSDNDNLSILVPAADGKMRFWRNTTIATQSAGQTATLPAGTLGFEWDADLDNGSRPAGTFALSTSTYTLTQSLLLDNGGTFGAGVVTHRMTLYKAPSGAFVFGAGTVQWSWGLDSNHDDGGQSADPRMQQATVNLFADMGIQPATLQPGVVPASASIDSIAPTSTITSPSSGISVTPGTSVTVSGTAADSGGGVVGGVEVSFDGGTVWHPANGRDNWNYTFVPNLLGTINVKSRAVDDSGNMETPSAGISVTVVPPDCPCDGVPASVSPVQVDGGDGNSGEFGVKFRTDFSGYITGIRFYKSALNTGSHIGNLWTSTGTLLASAIFTNETGSGWQQVSFGSPVAINANTTYVASYFAPTGHYSVSDGLLSRSGIDNPPVHLLANGVDGPNALFSYSSGSTFPTSSSNSNYYWVDVIFLPSTSMPGAPASLLAVPTNITFVASIGGASPAPQTVSLYNQGSGALNWTASKSASWLTLSATSGSTPSSLNVSINASGLVAGTYNGTVTINSSGNNPTQTIAVSLTVTNILLSTNFATQGLQGWVPSPLAGISGWSVVNQLSKTMIQYNGGGNAQIYAGNSTWTDYTLTVPVKFSTMTNWPGGIRGRVNPSTGAGYMLWLYPASGKLILYRASVWDINQGLVQIGSASAAFDTTNIHTVSLSFTGSQLRVLYDGNTLISITDATYSSGLIALEGLNQIISFADVVITSPNTNSASLGLSPSSVSYSVNLGAPNPTPQTVQLTAAGGVLPWTAVVSAPWLSASPASGISPASIQVSVNSSSLGPGTFNGTVIVTSLGAINSPQVINANITVIPPPPSIALSASGLNFQAYVGQPAPPTQTLSVANGGVGSFSYNVSTDSAWLTAGPSGSTPGNVSVNVNATGLATGKYTGNVIITASGIGNSPMSVPVSLQVLSQDMTEVFANLARGWIISSMGNSGGWTVANGIYSYNGAGFSQSCSGNTAWTDYSFDTNIKLSSSANWPGGVRARVNPSTGAGYLVWLYPGSNQLVLYKLAAWSVNDPSLAQLAQATMAFDTTAFHDLNITFQGTQILVSWDGKLMMSATDTTYPSGIVCMDADSQPISYSNVRVAAVQGASTFSGTPTSLVFSALPGAAPASQTLNVSAGGASVMWAPAVSTGASWLTATASSTQTPATVTVIANPAGLPEGTYNATITLAAPATTNPSITIPVTLAVKTAVLSVAPTAVNFFGTASSNPLPQSVQIRNLGTGVLGWAANSTSTWLGATPATGTAPSIITVAPNTGTLANGTYSDTITVTSPDVANSPVVVPITTQIGNLLFSDNFNAGAGNWTIGPLGFASGWSVVNGAYTYNGGGHTQSWTGSSAWTDYTVAANFQLSSANDYPGGIRGRLNTTTGASYGAWIYPTEGMIRLYRIDQWNIDVSNAILATATQLSVGTTVHSIRMSFQGSTIKVYFDDALVITAVDSTYTQGAIALDVSNQPIAFSNVSVISLP